MDQNTKLRRLADRRFRIATILTAAMIVLYFGFVSLVAFGKEFLARLIVPALGSTAPAIAASVVDLPAPFGPSKSAISPPCSSNDIPSTAARLP